MIYDSTVFMTIIDMLIVACPVYLLGLLLRHRTDVQRLGLTTGAALIVAGVGVIALLYLADFLSMHFVPQLIPPAEAMQIMDDLHQNYAWISILLGVGCIAFGLAYLLRFLIPQASAGTEILERIRIERAASESSFRVLVRSLYSG